MEMFILFHGPDPDLEGEISDQALFHDKTWHPDAEAIAILNGLILKVG